MVINSAEHELSVKGVLLRLASASDAAEVYAKPHATRIAKLAEETARLFDLGPRDITSIRFAALAHDFGELVMERDYIKRRGPLTEEERLDLERHPMIGEQEAARVGADRGAQLLVRWHHEWWNGNGYPDHLQKEQIPLGARILRVVDAYASLTDVRPYREAWNEQRACKHLVEWAGLEFDPRTVSAFLSLHSLPELGPAGNDLDRVTGPRSEIASADEMSERIGTSYP
jgi:HD-GYP domain-containing protein (c-di-GMP phosphodiesterase class II)